MDNIDRIIRENINRFLIQESSYERTMRFLVEYECAIITAWRGELKDESEFTNPDFRNISHEKGNRGHKIVSQDVKQHGDKFSTEEKKYNNNELRGLLLALKYGVQKVRGTYREGGVKESQEESYLVVNIHHDPKFKQNIFDMSEWYNQDSFIYSPEGSDEAFLVGTNSFEYPGYGKEEPSGKLHKYVRSMYMSRLGNKGFSFTNGEYNGDMTDEYANNYEDDKPQTFQDRKADRKEKIGVTEALHLETFDQLSINAKHAIGLRCGKILREIRNRKS